MSLLRGPAPGPEKWTQLDDPAAPVRAGKEAIPMPPTANGCHRATTSTGFP